MLICTIYHVLLFAKRDAHYPTMRRQNILDDYQMLIKVSYMISSRLSKDLVRIIITVLLV